MDNLFGIDKELTWADLGEGVKRKVMSHAEGLMLVKVSFEKGSIGAFHNHHHVQISYVQSGKFKYTIGGIERILEAGDSCVVPSMQIHGCECLEKGELIDSFTPERIDFL